MAYIARFSKAQTIPLGTALMARGDKWYMDPEDIKQYDTPFHKRYNGKFPHTTGPNASEEPFLLPNNPYPRMPFFHRQLRTGEIKYTFGDGIRRNCGETLHIREDWLLPQGGEWYRDNGTSSVFGGTIHLLFFIGAIYILTQFGDGMDEKWCVSLFAPKVYPFDNLFVEQGGNNLVPQKDRPYCTRRIIFVDSEHTMQH